MKNDTTAQAAIYSRIIQFINARTKGLINLSFDDARHIMQIYTGINKTGVPLIKKMRWDAVNDRFEFIRQIVTTQFTIDQYISSSLLVQPTYQSFQYQLYNASGGLEGSIYTSNANLFD